MSQAYINHRRKVVQNREWNINTFHWSLAPCSRGTCPREIGLPLCSESIFPVALTQLWAWQSFWAWLDQKAEACLPGMTNGAQKAPEYSRRGASILNLGFVLLRPPRDSLDFSVVAFVCPLCCKPPCTVYNAYAGTKPVSPAWNRLSKWWNRAAVTVTGLLHWKLEMEPRYLCLALVKQKYMTLRK